MVAGVSQQPVQDAVVFPPRLATPPLLEAVPATSMRFADLGQSDLLDPVLLRTIIEDLKFDHMMPVQEATLKELLKEKIDVLAEAKTGTGKTIAFLLPAIQTLLKKRQHKQNAISLLVITPTRELALQIANEARKLLGRHPQYSIHTAIGGTNKSTEQKRIMRGCDILVATPGRLNDHLQDIPIQSAFNELDTLVLDEADRLLDMGFLSAIKDILKVIPNNEESGRQGMLFSATIAEHVNRVAKLVLRPGFKFISTIPKGDVLTHERVPQALVTVPSSDDVVPALYNKIKSELMLQGTSTFKAIIFATTAELADFYAYVLEQGREHDEFPPISAMHSRLSQNKRTALTEDFRRADKAIMVATDVIARGMDFPDVTHVFQVGLPMNEESYVHRLGRTARAGKEGRAVFVVTEAERFFPKNVLKKITFTEEPASLKNKEGINQFAATYTRKQQTYQAWLGYHKGFITKMQWSAEKLVKEANSFAINGLGCDGVPELDKRVIGKMGLKGVPGLNIGSTKPDLGGRAGGGGGRGQRVSQVASTSAGARGDANGSTRGGMYSDGRGDGFRGNRGHSSGSQRGGYRGNAY